MDVTIVKFKLNPVHAKLDAQLRRNERVLEEGIRKWFAFTLKQIKLDLATKFQKDIASELTDWEYLQTQGEEILKPPVLTVMQSSGTEAHKLLQATASFDILNPQAMRAAGKFTAKLVKDVNQGTKAGIRAYIKAGIKEGKSMDKIARELRPLVGLTENQTESIMNYKKLLGDKDKFPRLTTEDIDRKTSRYAEKTHNRRTRTIARTETARAQNLGYATGMEDLGIEQLEFSAYHDDKLSASCARLDGNRYPVNEAAGIIPVHPNCRCAMLPVVADTSVCRGLPGEVAKAACIPPDKLHDEQVKDLIRRWEGAVSRSNKWVLGDKLRKLGYDVKKHKPLLVKPPLVTPPTITPPAVTTAIPQEVRALVAKWQSAASKSSKWVYANKLKKLGYNVKTKVYKPVGIPKRVTIPKPRIEITEDFAREAAKYTNETDFVNAQSTVYRAVGSKRKEGLPARHFATDRKLAEKYGTDVEVFKLSPDIKIVGFESKEAIPLVEAWGKVSAEEMRKLALKLGIDGVDYGLKGYGVAVFNTDKVMTAKKMAGLWRQLKVKPVGVPPVTVPKESFALKQKKWERSLTTQQKADIKYYTEYSQDVTNVQELVLGGHPVSALNPRELALLNRAKNIEKAVDNAPQYQGSIFRGMAVDTNDSDWLAFEARMRQPEFSFDRMHSFSMKKKLVEEFTESDVPGLTKVIFEMKKAPKRSAAIKNLAAEEYKYLDEVLVGADGKYKVISKTERKIGGVNNITYKIEEVISKPKLVPKPVPKPVKFKTNDDWLASLSSDQEFDLMEYTGGAFDEITDVQRRYLSGKLIRPNAEEVLALKQIKRIENAMDTAPVVKGEIWRGMNFSKFEEKDFKAFMGTLNKPEFSMRSLQSFTSSKDTAKSFLGLEEPTLKHRVLVRMKKSPKRSMNLKSFNPDEAEILVGANAKYKVVSNKLGKLEGKDVRFVELEEVITKPKLVPKPVPKPVKFKTEDEWLKSLSARQEDAIIDYSEGSYLNIASAQKRFLAGKKLTPKEISSLVDAQDIEKAIINAPVIKGPVYRGMKWKSTLDEDYKIFMKKLQEGEFGFSSIQSFTTSEIQAKKFAAKYLGGNKVRMHVTMKKAPIRSAKIKNLSKHPLEKEVLVGADSKYRMVDIKTRRVGDVIIHDVDLEEIVPKLKPTLKPTPKPKSILDIKAPRLKPKPTKLEVEVTLRVKHEAHLGKTLKVSAKKVSLAELDTDIMDVVSKTIDSITKKYPVIKNKISSIAANTSRKGTLASYDKKTKQLLIHNYNFADHKWVTKYLKKMKKTKVLAVEDPRGVIAHELGHAYVQSLPKSIQNKIFDTWFDLEKPALIKNVSRYGSTTPEEMFAESFARYHYGERNAFVNKLMRIAKVKK